MSSRIVHGDSAGNVQPIDWRSIRGVGASSGSEPPTSKQQSSPQDSATILAAQEAQWQKRLQDSEAEWRRRAEREYTRGLSEGEATGIRKAAAQVDPVLERLSRSLAELTSFRDRFRRESEHDLVKLAVAIARRVLRRELHIDPEAILGLVKVAMERISLREVHSIRTNAQDLSIIRKHLELIGAPAAITIEADPALERGAVLFETVRGTLDVTVDTQMDQIEAGFADIVGGRS